MEKFMTMLARTAEPVTVEMLVRDLRTLGVGPGMTLIVHSSLSSFGWVCGGAVAVIQALIEAVGEEGTVVMPAQSPINSDPRGWRNPPIPERWWQTVRESMPPYRPDLTPAGGMGRVAEAFRSMEGVLRSNHPKHSFTAFGPRAPQIVEGHSLSFGFGDESPTARLYDADARVLLLGTDYESCTVLHLAEFRAVYAGKATFREGSAILADGRRRWVEYDDLEEVDDFEEIGAAFERETDHAVRGNVAGADARLVPVRPLVDYAVGWMEARRKEV